MTERKKIRLRTMIKSNQNSYSANEKWEYVNYLDTGNITDNKIDNIQLIDLKEEKLPSRAKRKVRHNSIIFSTVRPNQRHFGIVKNQPENFLVSTGFSVIDVVDPKLDADYLYYLLSSEPIIEGLNSIAEQSTSAYPSIKPSDIENLELVIPEIKDQKKVASILKSLDDKIALNTKINKNLLEQAQALYAEIFVYKANPAWKIGHLSDFINIRYGKDHKKLADGIYPVYGSGGIMRYVEKPLYDRESVLIPRKGTLNNVMYVNEPFWSVDTMFFTEMKKPNVAKFVYHFVRSKNLASLNSGSAVPSMTTDILNAMELQMPDTDTLSKFETLVAPMYLTIQQNIKESSKLAEVRDSLLPRLMSGELDVSTLDL